MVLLTCRLLDLQRWFSGMDSSTLFSAFFHF
jgi:hypothetical protein